MEIKVFGPGCKRCTQTEENVKAAVAESGVDATVTKISDMVEMAKSGIMATPAVMIDGVVKSTGAVPSVEDVKSWLGKQSGGCCCGGEC